MEPLHRRVVHHACHEQRELGQCADEKELHRQQLVGLWHAITHKQVDGSQS
jgi:hypothetical protein